MVRLQQNNDQKQGDFLYCFQHQFSFCVPNFSEIVSLEMKNFRARLGKKSGQEQGFLWGNYELCVRYQKFAGEEEVTAEKVFPRSFSAFTDILLLPAAESLAAQKNILTCNAKYKTGIVPLLAVFFPLFEKLGYLPFSIKVEVTGNIFSRWCCDAIKQENRGPGFSEAAARGEAETAVKETETVARGAKFAAIEANAAVKEKKTARGKTEEKREEKAEATAQRIELAATETGAAVKKISAAVKEVKTTINVIATMERAGTDIPQPEAAINGTETETAGERAGGGTGEGAAEARTSSAVLMAPLAGEAGTAAEMKLKKYLQTVRPMMGELFPLSGKTGIPAGEPGSYVSRDKPEGKRGEQGAGLLARPEKGLAKTSPPVPDARYYQIYSLFYEYFYPELSPGEGSKKKTR